MTEEHIGIVAKYPNRILRITFVCPNCDELHELEGDAVSVMTHAAKLMLGTLQSGVTVVDATTVKMLEANIQEQMAAGTEAYCRELKRIFKEG